MTDRKVRVGGASAPIRRVVGDKETRVFASEYIDLVCDGRDPVRVRPGMFVYAVNNNTSTMTCAEALDHLDLLDVFLVREFVHRRAACVVLDNGSDDVKALVHACRVCKDIQKHIAPHRVNINRHDLVLCHVPDHVSAATFIAVMPADIGPGPEKLGTAGTRRVSAHSQDTDCKSIVPRDLARGGAVDKVRLVELHANSTPFVPLDDVAQFWDPCAKKASDDAADKAAAAALGPKKTTPSKAVVSVEGDSNFRDAEGDRPAPPPPPAPETKKRSFAPKLGASDNPRAGGTGGEVDPASKKKRPTPVPLAPLEIDLAGLAWHEHKAALSECITALLEAESLEEREFRISAEAHEKARLACLRYHKSFGEFVDSVVLAECNTRAAAAFVSRFSGALAGVAHALFLRPRVFARLVELSLAAGVTVTPLTSRILALAAQLRATH